MAEEAARWRTLAIDDLILEQRVIHAAWSHATNVYLDLLPEQRVGTPTTVGEALSLYPALENVPEFRLVCANWEVATDRWERYKLALVERLAELTFGEQLEGFRATSVANAGQYYDSDLLHTYRRVIEARVRYLFSNRVFNTHLHENDVRALMALYNLPEMLRDMREWIAWRALNREILVLIEPSEQSAARVEALLSRALEGIRQDQRQRQLAVASGLHPRSTSLLRRLNPSLLQEISQYTRIEPPAHQPWSIWPKNYY